MACINLLLPIIASTGQALMHLVQPMHSSSLIAATEGGRVLSIASFKYGDASTCSNFPKAFTVSTPPGGHLLIGAAPWASASA
ncbi:Uncharacterised protein [Legionella pneumophila]|nr:Uncharacterised protein [Legionella pneumophila]